MNQTSTDLTVHLIVQGLLKEGSCRSENPELTHHALNQYILVVKTQERRLPLHYTDDCLNAAVQDATSAQQDRLKTAS